MPAKKARGPETLRICVSSGIIACFSFASIILVFSTSSGVVIPAATAPAIDPNTALSMAEILSRPSVRLLHSFMPSHNGNCITVKGTSLMTVTLHPLYNSLHAPPTPTFLLCPKISLSAAPELGNCTACARCFTTSVGTRTAQAATSPALAAIICSTGSLHRPSVPLPGPPSSRSSASRPSLRNRLQVS